MAAGVQRVPIAVAEAAVGHLGLLLIRPKPIQHINTCTIMMDTGKKSDIDSFLTSTIAENNFHCLGHLQLQLMYQDIISAQCPL